MRIYWSLYLVYLLIPPIWYKKWNLCQSKIRTVVILKLNIKHWCFLIKNKDLRFVLKSLKMIFDLW